MDFDTKAGVKAFADVLIALMHNSPDDWTDESGWRSRLTHAPTKIEVRAVDDFMFISLCSPKKIEFPFFTRLRLWLAARKVRQRLKAKKEAAKLQALRAELAELRDNVVQFRGRANG